MHLTTSQTILVIFDYNIFWSHMNKVTDLYWPSISYYEQMSFHIAVKSLRTSIHTFQVRPSFISLTLLPLWPPSTCLSFGTIWRWIAMCWSVTEYQGMRLEQSKKRLVTRTLTLALLISLSQWNDCAGVDGTSPTFLGREGRPRTWARGWFACLASRTNAH